MTGGYTAHPSTRDKPPEGVTTASSATSNHVPVVEVSATASLIARRTVLYAPTVTNSLTGPMCVGKGYLSRRSSLALHVSTLMSTIHSFRGAYLPRKIWSGVTGNVMAHQMLPTGRMKMFLRPWWQITGFTRTNFRSAWVIFKFGL